MKLIHGLSVPGSQDVGTSKSAFNTPMTLLTQYKDVKKQSGEEGRNKFLQMPVLAIFNNLLILTCVQSIWSCIVTKAQIRNFDRK
jgi:hypothetical protein